MKTEQSFYRQSYRNPINMNNHGSVNLSAPKYSRIIQKQGSEPVTIFNFNSTFLRMREQPSRKSQRPQSSFIQTSYQMKYYNSQNGQQNKKNQSQIKKSINERIKTIMNKNNFNNNKLIKKSPPKIHIDTTKTKSIRYQRKSTPKVKNILYYQPVVQFTLKRSQRLSHPQLTYQQVKEKPPCRCSNDRPLSSMILKTQGSQADYNNQISNNNEFIQNVCNKRRLKMKSSLPINIFRSSPNKKNCNEKTKKPNKTIQKKQIQQIDAWEISQEFD